MLATSICLQMAQSPKPEPGRRRCAREQYAQHCCLQASIFSVELHAIHLAILIIRDHPEKGFVIFTHSLSSIQAIKNRYTSNSVCRRLQHEMHDILLTKALELCWMPSHVGILGNEEADLNAKHTSLQAAQPIQLHYTDWYPLLKIKIQREMDERRAC